MAVDVKVPNVGESIQEGMIEAWQVEDGQWINQDDILLSLETDKATVDIVAEVSGKITILAKEGQVVKIGETIANIDESASSETTTSTNKASSAQEEAAQKQTKENGPAVRRLASETNIDPKTVTGSGKDGRVTKQDMLAQLSSEKTSTSTQTKKEFETDDKRTTSRKPMSMMRRRIAERLLDAQKNSAILTTFNEVNMSNIIDLRKKYGEIFLEKNNVQ